jgi:hypothetical protein
MSVVGMWASNVATSSEFVTTELLGHGVVLGTGCAACTLQARSATPRVVWWRSADHQFVRRYHKAAFAARSCPGSYSIRVPCFVCTRERVQHSSKDSRHDTHLPSRSLAVLLYRTMSRSLHSPRGHRLSIHLWSTQQSAQARQTGSGAFPLRGAAVP